MNNTKILKPSDMILFESASIGVRYIKNEYNMFFVAISIKVGETFFSLTVNPGITVLFLNYSLTIISCEDESCKISISKTEEKSVWVSAQK